MICELQVLNIFWLCIGLMLVPRLTLGCMFYVLGYTWIACVVWAVMVLHFIYADDCSRRQASNTA